MNEHRQVWRLINGNEKAFTSIKAFTQQEECQQNGFEEK